MLPTFCPLTVWAISLEFCRKPSTLEADDFSGACYRKAMTLKKLWTLLFPQMGAIRPSAIVSLKRVLRDRGGVSRIGPLRF